MTGRARASARARDWARARARARARTRARAMGGKIINIPAGTIYTRGPQFYKGGPNLLLKWGWWAPI